MPYLESFTGGLGYHRRLLYHRAKNLKFGGDIDPCGIDSEIDGVGYNGSYKVDLVLEDIDCPHGCFEVGFRALSGSTIKANRIKVGIPPVGFTKVFGLNGGADATIEFSNSLIHTGMATAKGGNAIYIPGNAKFRDCTFLATNVGANAGSIVYAFPKILWNTSGTDYTNQTIAFERCTFTASNTLDSTYPRYGIICSPTDHTKNNQLSFNNCVFTDQLDTAATADIGGKFIFSNTIFNVNCRNIGGAQRYPLALTGYDGAGNWDVTLDNCSFNTTQYLFLYGYNTQNKNYLRQRKINISRDQNKIATRSGLAGNNYSSIGNDTIMRTITGVGAPGTLPGFKNADGSQFDQYIDLSDTANPKYYKCTNMNPFAWVQYIP